MIRRNDVLPLLALVGAVVASVLLVVAAVVLKGFLFRLGWGMGS